MLREERATSIAYDKTKDLLRIDMIDAGDEPFRSAELNLLVDARGHLVGVDLRSESDGVVVMLGAHEDVAEERKGAGEVQRARDGSPAAISIFRARSVVRVDEKNPYL